MIALIFMFLINILTSGLLFAFRNSCPCLPHGPVAVRLWFTTLNRPNLSHALIFILLLAVCIYVCMYVCTIWPDEWMLVVDWHRPAHLGNESGGVSAVRAGATVELPARATHCETPPGHGPDQLSRHINGSCEWMKASNYLFSIDLKIIVSYYVCTVCMEFIFECISKCIIEDCRYFSFCNAASRWRRITHTLFTFEYSMWSILNHMIKCLYKASAFISTHRFSGNFKDAVFTNMEHTYTWCSLKQLQTHTHTAA